mmetsp:Transcript_106533/g.306333  ORF Transcript_106533/g.306333 Transcript_106533/m.306333 type:complete len:672 (+) Transcript_106533:94-2109(+)
MFPILCGSSSRPTVPIGAGKARARDFEDDPQNDADALRISVESFSRLSSLRQQGGEGDGDGLSAGADAGGEGVKDALGALRKLRSELRAAAERQDEALRGIIGRLAKVPADAGRAARPEAAPEERHCERVREKPPLLEEMPDGQEVQSSQGNPQNMTCIGSYEGGPVRVGFKLEGLTPSHRKPVSMSERVLAKTSCYCASEWERFGDISHFRRLMERITSALRWAHSLDEPERTSFLARAIHSQPFDIVCMAFIGMNALYIAYTTDHEMQHLGEAPTKTMLFIELAFMLFYAMELVLKLIVHRMYFFINAEWPWNLFDLAVAMISIFEFLLYMWQPVISGTMNITFMRLLRVCKVAKVLRIFRSVRFLGELRMMIDCVVGSVVNLFWCLVFIGFVLYIFALLLVQGLSNVLAEGAANAVPPPDMVGIFKYFGTTTRAMLTLLMSTTGGVDWQVVYELVRYMDVFLPAVFISYLLFFAIAAWNIITSRFIEKALKLAQPDIETQATEHTMKDMSDATTLTKLFKDLDVDIKQEISLREFRDLMQHPKLRMYLQVRGIDIKDAEVFYAMLRSIVGDVSRVDVETLVNVCLRMRGFATAIDVQMLSFETRLLQKRQNVFFRKCSQQLAKLQECFDFPVKGVSFDNFPAGSAADGCPQSAGEEWEGEETDTKLAL